MSRTRTRHRCTDCGATSPTWMGRCPACGEWNSLVEAPGPSRGAPAGPGVDGLDGFAAAHTALAVAPPVPAQPITEVDGAEAAHRPTGIAELDRVLGGGLVPGSVTLVGGEPGAGKSTLLLQALGTLAHAGARTLLVSAEESAAQVRARAERLGVLHPRVHLVADTDAGHVLGHLAAVRPDVAVVDSIQTLHLPGSESAPGTVSQVRACTQALVAAAKATGTAVVLVGHVTKDGALAGPRTLEHLVDTVLAVEGDRHHGLRMVRAVKHRFGATTELGLFELSGSGLAEVPDPSGLFLADRRPGVPGSVVVPTLDGHRPLLVEIQALTARTGAPQPRRSAQGLDGGRLALLLAVLGRRAGIATHDQEVYVSAVGGARVAEPGADLAVALAVTSSLTGNPVPDDLVVCGEVGLAGELRRTAQAERRLREAARLGFRRALVAESTTDGPPGIELVRARRLAQAVALAGCGPDLLAG